MTRAVILIDVSGSMSFPVTPNSRRIDVLQAILNTIRPEAKDTSVIAFNHTAFPLESWERLPEPDGGTALHLALERAHLLHPEHVIVVSDGEPEDKRAAIAAAHALACRISTYYAGEEGNRAATAFLKTLALCSRGGVGRAMLGDLRNPEKLANEMKLLLLPGPGR